MIKLNTTLNTNIFKFIYLATTSGANRVKNTDFATSKKISIKVSVKLIKAFRIAKEKADTLAIVRNFPISGIKKNCYVFYQRVLSTLILF